MNQFLDELAQGTPTPGGGGAAALAGALAAALAQMVANLTIGRRKYQAAQEEVQQIQQRAEELRTELTQAIEDDAFVYQRVITILQHRTSNNDQTSIQAIEDALTSAAQVPLNVARRCQDTVNLLDRLAKIGNEHAIADAAAGAFIARAAIQASVLNMKANLKEVKNEKIKKSWLNQAGRIEKAVNTLVDQIATDAETRMTAIQEPRRCRRRRTAGN